MFFYLLGLIILCGFGIRFADRGTLFSDYIAKDKTSSIKGLFILLVFASHCAQYVAYEGSYDAGYMSFRTWSGQTVVAMFLFYSGYGIYYSIWKKGDAYVRRMPVRRILRLMVHFWIALVLFLIVNALIRKTYPLKRTLQALFAWEPIGNSNWYIFAIVLCYILTYLAYRVLIRKKEAALILVTALLFAAVIVLYRLRPDEGRYYNTLLCYACGMWYGRMKDRIDAGLAQNRLPYPIVLIAVTCAMFACRPFSDKLPVYILWTCLYSFMIVFLTMKIQIDNRALRWAGDHLFELFIVQRIPMRIFACSDFLVSKPYLFTILSFAATIPCAMGLRFLCDKADVLLNRIGSGERAEVPQQG